MKVFLSLYFFMVAIVQTGLFFGIFHYFRSQNLTKANQYWLGSLLSSSAALFVFGAGIATQFVPSSGTAVLLQSGSTWSSGSTVYISVVTN